MKRIILFFLFLIPFLVQAQIFSNDPIWGKQVQRVVPVILLGAPKDTFQVPNIMLPNGTNARDNPWVAILDSSGTPIPWYWSTASYIWKKGSGSGGGADGNNYPISSAFTNNVLTITRNGLSSITATWDSTKYHSVGFYDGRYTNIYNADGVLVGNRSMTGNYNLSFGTNINKLASFNAYTVGSNTFFGANNTLQATGTNTITSQTLNLEGTTGTFLLGLTNTGDSTAFKPVGINSTGQIKKIDYWFGGAGGSDGNNYPNASSFTNNTLVTGRQGLTDLTASWDSLKYHSMGFYDGRYQATGSGVDSLLSQYSVVGSGKTSNKFRLDNDSNVVSNTTPLAYQILNGRRGYYPVKADTADIFGIDSSLTFSNVTELRATQLYSKGGRLATTFGYTTRNDGGGSDYIWNGASTATDDGLLIFKPNALAPGDPGRWEWRAKGKVRASEVGVKSDGTDQTSKLNSLFSLSTVKDVVFDNGDVKITGKVNGQGKKLRFENNARIVGASGTADTLTNANIIADYKSVIFDTLLTVRNLQNSTRSVVWFGAVADYHKNGTTVSPTNNLTAFNNATKSGKEILTTLTGGTRYSTTIYIPAGETDYWYYMGDQWFIDQACEIAGDGMNQSVMKFPQQLRKSAIKIPLGDFNVVAGGYTGGRENNLHDFGITGSNYNQSQSNGIYDTASHGVEVTAPFTQIHRVKIEKFRGNGFEINASVGATPYTNANCGLLEWCQGVNNSGSGVHFQNSDANAWNVIGGNYESNGMSGIHTQDCLGQSFLGVHTSSNGYLNVYQRSTVSYGGNLYQATVTHTNHEPGAGDWYNYWHKVGLGGVDGVYVFTWDSTKTYVAAAAFYVDGASDFSTFTGCYAELDQNQFLNKGNGIAIGGFAAGTGTVNNTIGSYLGQLNTRSLWFMNQNNYGARVSGGDPNTGLMPHLGGYDYTRNHFAGWYYTTDDNGQTFRLVGDFGYASPLIFYDQAAANYAASTGVLGRSAAGAGNYNMSSAGEMLFQNGFFGSSPGASLRRKVEFADAAPTTGYHDAGEIVVNIGSTSGTVMWKCTVAGTPGTWVAETTGAGFSASITSPQTNDILKYNGSTWVNDNNAILGGLQVQGDNIDLTGAGLEFYYQTFTGYINSIGRDGTGWRPLNIQANTISLRPGGTEKFLLDGSKLTLADYAGTGNRITQFNSSGDLVRGTIDPANIADKTASNTYTAGMKQIFQADATNAGLKLAGVSADPSTLTNGDIWHNTTANHLYARLNGATYQLDQQAGGTTTNALSIAAELHSGGATSFNGSSAISLAIQAGSVTNAMLAGSIALSKLSITGTPDGTKFLRDDGSWQTVSGGSSSIATLTDVSLTSLATNDFLKYNGTSWINRTPANVLSDIGAMSNPMTSTGDLIYGGASGVPARLAAGTNGYMLSLIGGVPSWVNGANWGGLFTGGSVSSGTTGTIAAGVQYYISTASSTATYTLPALSSNRAWFLKNAGSADMIINRAGSDVIWTDASVTTFTLTAGQSAMIVGGSSSWYVFFQSSTGGSMVYPGAGIAVSTGSAWGTSLTAPSGSIVGTTDAQTLTNKDFTSGTNTFPTFNQNTTGSAATLTTARNINGVAFNGSTNITVPSDIAAGTSGNVMKSNGTVWTSAANDGGWTTVRVSGSDVTTTGQTLVDITGLASGTLTNSTKYEIEAVLDVSTSTGTAGVEYGIGAGGSGGAAVVSVIISGNTTGTTANVEGLSTTAGTASAARLLTASQSGTITFKGFVTTRGAGTATISIQHLKVTSGTSTVKVGSVFRYRIAQ